MDFEEILYQLRRNKLGKKILKIFLTGCLFVVIVFIILLIISILLAVKYHTQIFDGFMKIYNFIFGDLSSNDIMNSIKQFVNDFINNLFNEN